MDADKASETVETLNDEFGSDAASAFVADIVAPDADAGVLRHRKTDMVSSMAGEWGLVGAGNYASAKAGVLGLMRTLAQEWGRYRVNVNAVAQPTTGGR